MHLIIIKSFLSYIEEDIYLDTYIFAIRYTKIGRDVRETGRETSEIEREASAIYNHVSDIHVNHTRYILHM